MRNLWNAGRQQVDVARAQMAAQRPQGMPPPGMQNDPPGRMPQGGMQPPQGRPPPSASAQLPATIGTATSSVGSIGSAGGVVDIDTLQTKVQNLRNDMMRPLQEVLSQEPNPEMHPLVDMLSDEARSLVNELQEKMTTLMGEGDLTDRHFSVMEQVSNVASEFQELQVKADKWKRGERSAPSVSSPVRAASTQSVAQVPSVASGASLGRGSGRGSPAGQSGAAQLPAAAFSQSSASGWPPAAASPTPSLNAGPVGGHSSGSLQPAWPPAQSSTSPMGWPSAQSTDAAFPPFPSASNSIGSFSTSPAADRGSAIADAQRRSRRRPTQEQFADFGSAPSPVQGDRREEARKALQATLEDAMTALPDPAVLEWVLADARGAGVVDVAPSLVTQGEQLLARVRNDLQSGVREADSATRSHFEAQEKVQRVLDELAAATHSGDPDALRRSIEIARAAGAAPASIKSAQANLAALRFLYRAGEKVGKAPLIHAWRAFVRDLKAARKALKEALQSGIDADELERSIHAASEAGLDNATCDMALKVAANRRHAHDQTACALALGDLEELREALAMNVAAGGPRADVVHLDRAIVHAEKAVKEAEEDAKWMQSLGNEIPQVVDRYFDQLELHAKVKSESEFRTQSVNSIVDNSIALELHAKEKSLSEFRTQSMNSFATSPTALELHAKQTSLSEIRTPTAMQSSPSGKELQLSKTADVWKSPVRGDAHGDEHRSHMSAAVSPHSPTTSASKLSQNSNDEEWNQTYSSMLSQVERARRWFSQQETAEHARQEEARVKELQKQAKQERAEHERKQMAHRASTQPVVHAAGNARTQLARPSQVVAASLTRAPQPPTSPPPSDMQYQLPYQQWQAESPPMQFRGSAPVLFQPAQPYNPYSPRGVALESGPQSVGATPLGGAMASAPGSLQQQSGYDELRGASSYHDHMANAVQIAQKQHFQPRRHYEDPDFWR